MARRALEIGCAVASAASMGLPVGFVTFTARHHSAQRLSILWDAIGHAWGRSTGGVMWQRDVAAYGVEGFVRVIEATYGRNGWHPHAHGLVFGWELDRKHLDELSQSMWSRWSSGLQSKGLSAPLMKASDWQLVTGDLSGTKLGGYLSKGLDAAASIGMELTQTQSKVARGVHKTRPVWELLDGAIDGEVSSLRLWHEWEKASKGRRQIAWSRGLREMLGVGVVEKSDEDVAAEETGTRDDTVIYITRGGWDQLVRRSWLIPLVLDRAEQTGVQGLSAWLWSEGIDHRRVQ